MDVVKILLAGLKHALKILSFVTEKIQKKKATEVRCLCFLHEIVLFFFFFWPKDIWQQSSFTRFGLNEWCLISCPVHKYSSMAIRGG